MIDPLARTGHCKHSVLPAFKIYQQGGLDCYCGSYATVNTISFMRQYGPQPRTPLSNTELIKIIARFDSLHESLGLLGDLGTEGYQLLPAAGAAFFQAGFKDARLSLRESIRATTERRKQTQFEQSEEERKLPARIGIELQQNLQPESGGTLALAAVYECNHKPDNTWKISHEDVLGHWVAIVGKGYVPETYSAALDEYNGIVLNSNRGYELWRTRWTVWPMVDASGRSEREPRYSSMGLLPHHNSD